MAITALALDKHLQVEHTGLAMSSSPRPGLLGRYDSPKVDRRVPPSYQGLVAAQDAREAGENTKPVVPGVYPGTEKTSVGPKRVRYTHDAMIDVIIQNPAIAQGELAIWFGYTESWVSLIMSSDAFRARLEARREELVDPSIRLTIEERFRALATKSLEVLQKKLDNPNVSDQLALQAAALAAKSLGLGLPKNVAPPAPEPDRLERIGGRLLALLGERAIQANRSLDYEIIDTPAREVRRLPTDGEERDVQGPRSVQHEPGQGSDGVPAPG